MNAAELLSELQTRHVELRVVGDRLRIRPAEALPPSLRAELRARQAEVVELLRARGGRCLAEALPGGVVLARESHLAAETLTMWLPDFARARRVVEVRSDLLDEVVVLASDDAVLDPGERRVVYRAAELQAMTGLTPQEFQTVHAAKRAMDLHILPS